MTRFMSTYETNFKVYASYYNLKMYQKYKESVIFMFKVLTSDKANKH